MRMVTETACPQLAQMLDHRGVPPGIAMRFTVKDPSVAAPPYSKHNGDRVFQRKGRTVSWLDEGIAAFFADEPLDFREIAYELQPASISDLQRR